MGTRSALVVAGLAALGAVGFVVWRGAARDLPGEAARPSGGSTAALDASPSPAPGGPVLAGAGVASPARNAAPPEEAAPVAPADSVPTPVAQAADGTVAVEVEVVEAGVTPDKPVEGAGLAWTCRGGSGCGTGGRVPGVVLFGTPPFTVWVTAPGFVAQRLVDVGAVATLRVELQRGVPARVRFTGENGQPIPIEEVRARYAASSSLRRVNVIPDLPVASMGDILKCTYGPPGAWLLESELLLDGAEPRLRDALGSGRWTLSIPRPGLWPAHATGVTEADGAIRFEVRLPEPRPVRVHLVAAETGEALAGAQVVLGPSSTGPSHSAWTPPSIADEEGYVDLPSTEEGQGLGRWWVIADERTTVIDEAALRGFPAPHEIRVPVEATLRGRAFTPAGRPAARWEVAARGPGFRVTQVVGDDGRYDLRVPGPLRADTPRGGRVELSLVDPAYAEFGGAEARVLSGEVAEVDIGSSSEGRPTATISGRLTAGGRPLAGRLVQAGGPPTATGAPANRSVFTRADGRFELVGLEPTRWTLLVLLGGGLPGFGPGTLESQGPIVLRPDEVRPLVVDLPGGRLRVRVLEGAAGGGVRNADVRALPRERGKRDLAGLSFTPGTIGVSGADGTVVLDGLDPGAPHQVFVTKPGTREQVTVDAVPADGDVIPEVVVRLP